jgi:hypothetical protein
MDRYLRPRATYFLSILMLAFGVVTRAQEQTATGPQTESSAAKAKLNAEEAESGTSEGTEVLQKSNTKSRCQPYQRAGAEQ